MHSALIFLALAALPSLGTPVVLSLSGIAALFDAQNKGRFNTTNPLVVVLAPGVYSLPDSIAITAPSLEIRGLDVDLVCDEYISALQLYVPGPVHVEGLSISKCGGSGPALMIEASSNITLDQLSFSANTAGALAIDSNTSMVTLVNCSFSSNSLASATFTNSHAVSIVLDQGTVSMDLVSYTGNGFGSTVDSASVSQVTCR